MTANPQELAEFGLAELSNVLKVYEQDQGSRDSRRGAPSIGGGFADAARVEIGFRSLKSTVP